MPASDYRKKNEDLIVFLNATDNSYISIRNATDFQLEKIKIDCDLNYDAQPSMFLTLGLRGPK